MRSNIKKHFLIFFLSVIIFAPYSSHAIRIVLSGGGPAEMMALSASRQMSSLLLMASHSPILDKLLKSEDREKIKKLAMSPEFRPGYFEMGFLYGENEEVPNSWPLMKVYLKSQNLYELDGSPKSYNRIGYHVFMALMETEAVQTQLMIQQLSHVNWEKLAGAIFLSIHTSKETTHLELNGTSQLEVFSVQSVNKSYSSTFLYLRRNQQGQEDLTEITPDLLKAINCQTSPQLSYLGQFQVRDSLVLGQINWICGGSHMGAKVAIPLAQLVNNKDQIDFEFLMLRELPWPTGVQCQQALVPNEK
jgi:hypothetical protein